jgi:hypothetical protein
METIGVVKQRRIRWVAVEYVAYMEEKYMQRFGGET